MGSERIDHLSPRERECLRLVGRGFSSKEIGQRLGISYHTVDDHLKRAISGLEVKSRFEAARLLADRETGSGAPPQQLGAQPQRIDSFSNGASTLVSDRNEILPWWLRVPFLRNGRRSNELSPMQRLTWIVVGSVAILFGLSQLANILMIVQSIARGR